MRGYQSRGRAAAAIFSVEIIILYIFFGYLVSIIGESFAPLTEDGAIVVLGVMVWFVGCAAGFSWISMDGRAPATILVNNGP